MSRSPSRNASRMSGSLPVEVLQAAVEVHRVVAVTPEHVRLDEIHEHEPLVDVLEQLDRSVDAVDVRLRRKRVVDVAAREDVEDLPDAVHRAPRVAHRREVVRTARLQGEVVPVGRAFVVPRLADERAGDHAPNRMPAREDLAGDAAAVVELLERDRLLVGGDLEDRVGGRVDDPLAGPLVLFSELLDDLRSRGGPVADDPAARLVHERVDHLVREAMRVCRERGRRDHAHHLPVTRGRVLALRALHQSPGNCGRPGLRRAAFQRDDVSEPERLEIGQVEASDRAGHVAESVGAFVPVLRCVRQLTSADGIEHDHARPRHGGILRRLWRTSSACCCSWSTSRPSSASPQRSRTASSRSFRQSGTRRSHPTRTRPRRIAEMRAPAAASSGARSAKRPSR